jgi:hypothetical protein
MLFGMNNAGAALLPAGFDASLFSHTQAAMTDADIAKVINSVL